ISAPPVVEGAADRARDRRLLRDPVREHQAVARSDGVDVFDLRYEVEPQIGRISRPLECGVRLAQAIEKLSVSLLDAPPATELQPVDPPLHAGARFGVARPLVEQSEKLRRAGMRVEYESLVGVPELVDVAAPAVPPRVRRFLGMAVCRRRLREPEALRTVRR